MSLGCLEVEAVLQKYGRDRPWAALDKAPAKVKATKCYKAVRSGDCGHENYAVCAFAAQQGDLQSLRKLHDTYGDKLEWHADLAQVAAECGQVACLEYIMDEMGDVFVPRPFDKRTDAVNEYLRRRADFRKKTYVPKVAKAKAKAMPKAMPRVSMKGGQKGAKSTQSMMKSMKSMKKGSNTKAKAKDHKKGVKKHVMKAIKRKPASK